MKQLATNYLYNPTAKTVTLLGLNIPLGYVLLIVNATRGQVIYNLADPNLKASNFVRASSSILTLSPQVSTSSHQPGDSLTIFFDNGAESQMVLVQGPIGPQGPAGPPTLYSQTKPNPSIVSIGTRWIETFSLREYVWTGGAWVEISWFPNMRPTGSGSGSGSGSGQGGAGVGISLLDWYLNSL